MTSEEVGDVRCDVRGVSDVRGVGDVRVVSDVRRLVTSERLEG